MNAPQPPALPANFLTAVRPDRAARHAAGLDRRREYPLEAHAALPQPDERRDATRVANAAPLASAYLLNPA